MNYLKTARRDKKGAVISIVVGVVFFLLYMGGIAFANLYWKSAIDAAIAAHPVRTILGFLSTALVVFGIGMFSFFRGVKLLDTYLPPVGAVSESRDTIVKELLAFNGKKYPFTVKQDGRYIRCEWKLADASWYTLFGKAGLGEKYILYLRPDERKKSVYAIEYMSSLDWNASVPRAGFFWQFSYGWHALGVEWHKVYGIKDINPITIGKVCDYSYDINTIRLPIMNIVLKNGWAFRPAAISVRWGL